MVDWKKIGDKTLDITKKTVKAGTDSFVDWKNDSERIAKVNEKKEHKKEEKAVKKENKMKQKESKIRETQLAKLRKTEGKGANLTDIKAVVNNSTFKSIKTGSLITLTQTTPGYVFIKKGKKDFDFRIDEIHWKDVQNNSGKGIGGALVGGLIGGSTGAIVGATTAKGKISDESYAILILTSVESETTHKIEIKCGFGNAIILQKFIPFSINASEDISNSTATTEELRNFKSLLDDGVITQEEFDSKKKELLGL